MENPRILERANDTLLFKTVIGSYDNFISSDIAVPTIQATVVYKDNTGTKAEPKDWLPEVYRILLRHYRNWEIYFDNADDFLDILWERIEIYAPNYFVKKFYYDRLLSLNEDDLLNEGISVHNFVQHTNDAVENVWEPLKQLTNQDGYKNIGAISTKIKAQIYSVKMAILKEFVDKFKDLFILTTCSSNYFG